MNKEEKNMMMKSLIAIKDFIDDLWIEGMITTDDKLKYEYGDGQFTISYESEDGDEYSDVFYLENEDDIKFMKDVVREWIENDKGEIKEDEEEEETENLEDYDDGEEEEEDEEGIEEEEDKETSEYSDQEIEDRARDLRKDLFFYRTFILNINYKIEGDMILFDISDEDEGDIYRTYNIFDECIIEKIRNITKLYGIYKKDVNNYEIGLVVEMLDLNDKEEYIYRKHVEFFNNKDTQEEIKKTLQTLGENEIKGIAEKSAYPLPTDKLRYYYDLNEREMVVLDADGREIFIVNETCIYDISKNKCHLISCDYSKDLQTFMKEEVHKFLVSIHKEVEGCKRQVKQIFKTVVGFHKELISKYDNNDIEDMTLRLTL